MKPMHSEKLFLITILGAAFCFLLLEPTINPTSLALAQQEEAESEESTDPGPFDDLEGEEESNDVSAFGDLDEQEEAGDTAEENSAEGTDSESNNSQESGGETQEVDYSGKATVASPSFAGNSSSGLLGVEQYDPYPEEEGESEEESAEETDYSPKVAFADPLTGQVPDSENATDEEDPSTEASSDSSAEEEEAEEDDFSTDPFGDLEDSEEEENQEEEDFSTDPFGDLSVAESEDSEDDEEEDGPFSDLD